MSCGRATAGGRPPGSHRRSRLRSSRRHPRRPRWRRRSESPPPSALRGPGRRRSRHRLRWTRSAFRPRRRSRVRSRRPRWLFRSAPQARPRWPRPRRAPARRLLLRLCAAPQPRPRSAACCAESPRRAGHHQLWRQRQVALAHPARSHGGNRAGRLDRRAGLAMASSSASMRCSDTSTSGASRRGGALAVGFGRGGAGAGGPRGRDRRGKRHAVSSSSIRAPPAAPGFARASRSARVA